MQEVIVDLFVDDDEEPGSYISISVGGKKLIEKYADGHFVPPERRVLPVWFESMKQAVCGGEHRLLRPRMMPTDGG